MRRLVIVGVGPGGRALVRALGPSRRVQILGFLHEGPTLSCERVEGLPVLGSLHRIEQWLEAIGPTDVVMNLQDAAGMRVALTCLERGLSVIDWTAAYENLLRQVPVGLDGCALLHALEVRRPGLGFRFVHRLLDVVAGVVLLLSAGLLTPLVALIHFLECPGPLFYRQVRIGRRGRCFLLWKFRTMQLDAEVKGPEWATKGDTRATRVGCLLRRFHLDEFPQAWNLLKGEMSFIGPRPERPEFVRLLETLPGYRARHAVRPGITGWAQVHYRYSASLEEYLEKLRYDLYYVKHRGVALDLLILLKTLMVLLRGQGQ